MSYVNRLQVFDQKERKALDLMFKDLYFGNMRVHDHSSNAQGGKLDWDSAFTDAVHNHSSNAEGGKLDWDDIWADAVHTHQSNAEGGTLDHGLALTGLTDDDHTQYLLINGTRAMTGDLTIPATNKIRLDGSLTGDTYLFESVGNVLDAVIGGSTRFRMYSNVAVTGGDFVIDTTRKLRFDSSDSGDTYTTESSGNVLDDVVGGTTILRRTSSDVYTTNYTDYSATSTVTGWSSFTTKLIYYKKIGKLVWVWFHLIGTSNATSISFTLPFTSANTVQTEIKISGKNSGTWGVAEGVLAVNASTINFFYNNYNTWTNSGDKQIVGQFSYQTA